LESKHYSWILIQTSQAFQILYFQSMNANFSGITKRLYGCMRMDPGNTTSTNDEQGGRSTKVKTTISFATWTSPD
jgi:hypothetical protein